MLANLAQVDVVPGLITADLHMHSLYSDGSDTPAQLAEKLKDHVSHWSLTDHDTIDGVSDAFLASQIHRLNFYAGVEISTRWQPSATRSEVDVHIVGLGLTKLDDIQNVLKKQQSKRAERAWQISEKLAHILKIDCWSELCSMVGGDPARLTRSHFARLLQERKVVERPQQAFNRFLAQGKSAYVPIEALSIATAVEAIKQSGGVAVLAHPAAYQFSATVSKKLIHHFVEVGGQAIEMPSDKEPLSFRQMIEKTAHQYQLYASYGSDYHGSFMPWNRLGQVSKISQTLPHVLNLLSPLQQDMLI